MSSDEFRLAQSMLSSVSFHLLPQSPHNRGSFNDWPHRGQTLFDVQQRAQTDPAIYKRLARLETSELRELYVRAELMDFLAKFENSPTHEVFFSKLAENMLRLPCTFRGCASKNDVARPD